MILRGEWLVNSGHFTVHFTGSQRITIRILKDLRSFSPFSCSTNVRHHIVEVESWICIWIKLAIFTFINEILTITIAVTFAAVHAFSISVIYHPINGIPGFIIVVEMSITTTAINSSIYEVVNVTNIS